MSETTNFEDLPENAQDMLNKSKRDQAKDLKGKADWSLINLKDIEGIVRIREFGSTKYNDRDNWQLVKPIDFVNAIKRHLAEMDEHGIDSLDDESGMPHIWHIGCNYNFLSNFYRTGRIKDGKEEKETD